MSCFCAPECAGKTGEECQRCCIIWGSPQPTFEERVLSIMFPTGAGPSVAARCPRSLAERIAGLEMALVELGRRLEVKP